MCKNVKQNVLFERSEFTFCSFCMCKSRPETKSEDEAPPFDKLRDRIVGDSLMYCGFGARTHDRASLLSTFDLRLATLGDLTIQRFYDSTKINKRGYLLQILNVQVGA